MKTPTWLSTLGLCPSYGQLWVIYATESPKFVATCSYLPLLKDWSEVELTYSLSPRLELLSSWLEGALGMAVLSPGPPSYEHCRILFTFQGMTVLEQPDTFAYLCDEEDPIYKVAVTPGFQDTSAQAWATVWRKRADRWWHRQRARLARWRMRKWRVT